LTPAPSCRRRRRPSCRLLSPPLFSAAAQRLVGEGKFAPLDGLGLGPYGLEMQSLGCSQRARRQRK
jgi:hypothetical protein